MDVVALIIRAAIDRMDERDVKNSRSKDESEDDAADIAATDSTATDSNNDFQRIVYGARRQEISLSELSEMHEDDSAFNYLVDRVSLCLGKILGHQRFTRLDREHMVSNFTYPPSRQSGSDMLTRFRLPFTCS